MWKSIWVIAFVAMSTVAPAASSETTDVSFPSAKYGASDKRPTQTIEGIFAKPKGKGPFPAIVLLHTCGGVRSHVSEDWPSFFTANGYAALTVDTFGSRNAGKCPEARHLQGVMMDDAYGALFYLAIRPDIDPNRIGVMGFSLGAMALEQTTSSAMGSLEGFGGRNFKVGISVYGDCDPLGEPVYPFLAIIGERDGNASNCPQEKIRMYP
jgi:dienelactone hydrolase